MCWVAPHMVGHHSLCAPIGAHHMSIRPRRPQWSVWSFCLLNLSYSNECLHGGSRQQCWHAATHTLRVLCWPLGHQKAATLGPWWLVDLSKCNPVEAALSGDEVFGTKDESLGNSWLSRASSSISALPKHLWGGEGCCNRNPQRSVSEGQGCRNRGPRGVGDTG